MHKRLAVVKVISELHHTKDCLGRNGEKPSKIENGTIAVKAV
jgi:hypothetical protein